MIQYGLSLKSGYDIIFMTRQNSIREAKEYFMSLKRLDEKQFDQIFVVIEIKN